MVLYKLRNLSAYKAAIADSTIIIGVRLKNLGHTIRKFAVGYFKLLIASIRKMIEIVELAVLYLHRAVIAGDETELVIFPFGHPNAAENNFAVDEFKLSVLFDFHTASVAVFTAVDLAVFKYRSALDGKRFIEMYLLVGVQHFLVCFNSVSHNYPPVTYTARSSY